MKIHKQVRYDEHMTVVQSGRRMHDRTPIEKLDIPDCQYIGQEARHSEMLHPPIILDEVTSFFSFDPAVLIYRANEYRIFPADVEELLDAEEEEEENYQLLLSELNDITVNLLIENLKIKVHAHVDMTDIIEWTDACYTFETCFDIDAHEHGQMTLEEALEAIAKR